uniref:Retrotransposon gag domain-containing protein n=1 Tax=Fagus sylvatica TaxID=28930 RepID=A0A2N9GWV1_FAGSY
MTGETSGPSAQDIRMASFEEKFNDLLNFVRLLVQPSKPEERDFQLDAKVEKTMRSTKMVDASALLALAKPDVENEARTVDPNVAPENDPSPKGNWNTLEGPQSLQMYGNGEENVMNKKEDDHSDIRIKNLKKKPQSPISKKEEPKEVDHPMIPHKRYTPKNVVERVEQLEKRLDEVVQSMHQLITLTGTLLKDDRKAIRDLASHSTIGQASTKSLSKRETRRHRRQGNSHASHWSDTNPAEIFLPSAKLKSESRKFCTLPMPMDELYPRLLEKRLISPVFLKQSPHLLHDSSKKCEFHFGRPGHSLEDCHALKNKVQDLVDHGILRINEGSTPSVIIAWPPERCKDEDCHPFSSVSRAHYLWHSASSFDHATNTLRVLIRRKPNTAPSRCVTLKRKIQGLGHSEPDVPFMVQARKPSMHTVPMKKARSTLGFRANGPSRDQTERTISRSTGAWIPHRQG